MDADPIIKIALATVGAAFIRAGWSRYREWKAERALLPSATRNSGALTDGRLLAFEIVFWAMIIGPAIFGAALFFAVFGLNVFGHEIVHPMYNASYWGPVSP